MPLKGFKQSPETIEKKRRALRKRWEAMTEEERKKMCRPMREGYRAKNGPPKTPEERRAANAEYMRRKRAAARQGEDRRAKLAAIIAAARPVLEKVERAKREGRPITVVPYGYVRKERPL